jgi:hypothetical protein
MMIFSRREHALDVAVQRPHDADARHHGWAVLSATRISASVAVCHSGKFCSALGNFIM